MDGWIHRYVDSRDSVRDDIERVLPGRIRNPRASRICFAVLNEGRIDQQIIVRRFCWR